MSRNLLVGQLHPSRSSHHLHFRDFTENSPLDTTWRHISSKIVQISRRWNSKCGCVFLPIRTLPLWISKWNLIHRISTLSATTGVNLVLFWCSSEFLSNLISNEIRPKKLENSVAPAVSAVHQRFSGDKGEIFHRLTTCLVVEFLFREKRSGAAAWTQEVVIDVRQKSHRQPIILPFSVRLDSGNYFPISSNVVRESRRFVSLGSAAWNDIFAAKLDASFIPTADGGRW